MTVQQLKTGIETAWKHAYRFRPSPGVSARRRRGGGAWHELGYRFYAHNLNRFYNCDWIIGRAPDAAPADRGSS